MSKKLCLNDSKFLHKMLGTDPTKPEEMQPKEVLSYSIAGLGQNLICQLVTSFFLFFLTDAVQISAMWLAWMFLGARLFDAFNDPIMGTIVDRTRSKHGKMRPYLKYMPIPIVILTVLMFAALPVSVSITAKFIYATIIYIMWGVCYTTVDVPYWGLASSMTSDTNKRNSMLTVARLFCMVGAGVVTVLIPAIQGGVESAAIANAGIVNSEGVAFVKDLISVGQTQAGQIFNTILNADGAVSAVHVSEATMSGLKASFASGYKTLYLVTAIIVAVVALPTFWIGYKNTKERFYEKDSKKASLGHNLKLLTKNRPILLLIAVGVLGCLRLIYMTSGIYYAKYNLNNTGLFSIITLLVVPGGLIATLTTPFLSRKIGKRNVFLFSHLVGGIAMLLVYFIGLPTAGSNQASQVLFFIVLVLLGLPSGYSNILQYSMIADSIDYLEDRTGERAEGICFSMQTFISKIGMAFTAFTVLLVLGAKGYSGEDINATEGTKNGIWMMTTLLAGLSTLLCCVPLFFYGFTEKRQAQAIARINARKAAVEEQGLVLNAENLLKVEIPSDEELFIKLEAEAKAEADEKAANQANEEVIIETSSEDIVIPPIEGEIVAEEVADKSEEKTDDKKDN